MLDRYTTGPLFYEVVTGWCGTLFQPIAKVYQGVCYRVKLAGGYPKMLFAFLYVCYNVSPSW
jgi:hypothetical protein